jgi:hypothetical protein
MNKNNIELAITLLSKVDKAINLLVEKIQSDRFLSEALFTYTVITLLSCIKILDCKDFFEKVKLSNNRIFTYKRKNRNGILEDCKVESLYRLLEFNRHAMAHPDAKNFGQSVNSNNIYEFNFYINCEEFTLPGKKIISTLGDIGIDYGDGMILINKDIKYIISELYKVVK